VTVTVGKVVARSVSGAVPCALLRWRKPSQKKAMETREAAKAVGLENLGCDLTVTARTAAGRQVALDDISQQLPV
jgi:hypothetical protein